MAGLFAVLLLYPLPPVFVQSLDSIWFRLGLPLQSFDSLRVAGKVFIRVELWGGIGVFWVSVQLSVNSYQLPVKCVGPAGGRACVVGSSGSILSSWA